SSCHLLLVDVIPGPANCVGEGIPGGGHFPDRVNYNACPARTLPSDQAGCAGPHAARTRTTSAPNVASEAGCGPPATAAQNPLSAAVNGGSPSMTTADPPALTFGTARSS